jgi:hypothetical protein
MNRAAALSSSVRVHGHFDLAFSFSTLAAAAAAAMLAASASTKAAADAAGQEQRAEHADEQPADVATFFFFDREWFGFELIQGLHIT